MEPSNKHANERNALVQDAQDALRRSKRRAYFGGRRKHREESLMYRDPVFPEAAALAVPVLESFRMPSRALLFRPSWPNAVSIFAKYTPVIDGDRLRMRVVGTSADSNIDMFLFYKGPCMPYFALSHIYYII
jgi:hypothetical protein